MKNRYEIRGEDVVIFLNKKDGKTLETIISKEDLELVKSFPNTWSTSYSKSSKSYYVIGYLGMEKGKAKNVSLHRWIMNPPKSKVVDHINHDTLDNRRSNLRIVNQGINVLNQRSKGVYHNKKSNKWVARISTNGKRKTLGSFETEEAAIQAVKDEREKLIIRKVKYMPQECIFCGLDTKERIITVLDEKIPIHWSCSDMMKEQYNERDIIKCIQLERKKLNF